MTGSAEGGPEESRHPFISVIVPVRNGARHLPRLLESLNENDYPGDRREIVVVDHASQDGTAALARQAGVTVVSADRGPVGALRNLGVREARGSILAFVDADHQVGPRWLRAAAAGLGPSDVAIVGDLCRAPVDGNWVQHTFDLLRARVDEPRDVTWLGSGNMAMARTAFEAVGGFDESLEVCEDVDLCQRVIDNGWRIRAEPGMHNVHFGDPATLGAVVRGERWRGRDNLRVSFRQRPPVRAWPGILMPVAGLLALAGAAAGLLLTPWVGPLPLFVSLGVLVAIVALRTLVLMSRGSRINPIALGQSIAVASAFELGRALALVAGASHDTRRGSRR